MKQAFICCPGPSLKKEDIPLFHSKGDIYTVNRALRYFIDEPICPKGAFFLDMPHFFTLERKEIDNPRTRKIIRKELKPYWGDVPNTHWLHCKYTLEKNYDPFSKDLKFITGPKLTCLVAFLYIARLREYERIVLVGWDLATGGSGKSMYCVPTEQPLNLKERSRRIKAMSCVYRTMRVWTKPMKKHGVQAYLYGPSKLDDTFKRLQRGEL